MGGGAQTGRDRRVGRSTARLPGRRTASGRAAPSLRQTSTWSRIEAEGQPWTATCFALQQLRAARPGPRARRPPRRTVALVGANARWEEGGQPYWEGEVEECINGRTVADGAYFGVDVTPIVDRLLGERQPDGGWNCERANGSTPLVLRHDDQRPRRAARAPARNRRVGRDCARRCAPARVSSSSAACSAGCRPVQPADDRVPAVPASEPLALRRSCADWTISATPGP